MSRLRFGTFLAPFHPAGENPTLALQRDLRLVEHLDDLGYDEAWIGEHHSAGSEIIASRFSGPEQRASMKPAVASGSNGNSRNTNRTLPVSINCFFSVG